MNLQELINRLEALNPKAVVRRAFDNPHSSRDCYVDLAFEVCGHRRVGDMLADCRRVVGTKLPNRKSDQLYGIGPGTNVRLVKEWNATGEELGHLLLDYILADIVEDEEAKP